MQKVEERDEVEPSVEASRTSFEDDLENLSNSALRRKYDKEANSHRNRKAYAKKKGWLFSPDWEDFRSFLRDMGPIPDEGYTLDRIDPTLESYGPGLCRWASKTEQSRNRSITRYISVCGDRVPLAQFAQDLGKPYKTVHSALARGMTPEQLLDQREKDRQPKYRPLRYLDDPEGLRAWYEKYKPWRAKVRKTYPEYAQPEIFDLVAVAKLFQHSEAHLKRQGYFELTPDEQARATELEQSIVGSVFVNGVEWMNYAIERLGHRNPNLSRKLWSSRERYRSFADLHDELIRERER